MEHSKYFFEDPSIFSDQDPSRPRPTLADKALAGGGLWAPKKYATNLPSSSTGADQQMRITLSIQTMVNLLTGPMKIPKSKLNLGLAYYGRNFQQDPSLLLLQNVSDNWFNSYS